MDCEAAPPRYTEIPVANVRSVPKTALAPPPTRQTAQKERLNFLYSVICIVTMGVVPAACALLLLMLRRAYRIKARHALLREDGSFARQWLGEQAAPGIWSRCYAGSTQQPEALPPEVVLLRRALCRMG